MTTPAQTIAIVAAHQRRADIAFELARAVIKGENSVEAASRIKALAIEAKKAEADFWTHLSIVNARNIGSDITPSENADDFAADAIALAHERSFGPIVTSSTVDLTSEHRLTAVDLGVGRYAEWRR